MNEANEKGLIKPEDIKTPAKKTEKKISLDKNDIVERGSVITTNDGRQLLK